MAPTLGGSRPSSLPPKTEVISPSPEAEKQLATEKRKSLSKSISPEQTHALAVLEKWESQGLFSCPLKQQKPIIEKLIVFAEDTGMDLAELSPDEAQMVIDQLGICVIKKEEKKSEKQEEVEKNLDGTKAVEAVKKLQASGATTIGEYETALKNLGLSEKVYAEYALELEKIKAQLNAVSNQFTPEQQQKIFGGRLIDKVQINFGGSCNAEVFANVFTLIDTADISDAEKTEFKEKACVALNIPLKNQRAKGAGQLKSQLYLRQQEAGAKANPDNPRPAPLEKENAVILQDSPRVIVYSNPTGATDYICEGHIDNADPITLPFDKEIDDETLNALMNQHFFRAVASNHGGHGVLANLMGTGTLMSGAVKEQTETSAFGNNEMMETILHMIFGVNTALYSRFLTPDELNRMADNMRFMVPDGDFGAFNAINQAEQTKLLQGLGFGKDSEGQKAMRRAGSFMRSIGASGGEKSYQLLYDEMYPQDKKSGYPRLREKIGEDLVDRLFGVYGGEELTNDYL